MSNVCCPPNAEEYLAPDYQHKGKILTTPEGIDFYAIGEENIARSKRCIYILPDIFGWNAGRTRNIADYYAEQGYYVVIPRVLTPPVNGGTDGDGTALKILTMFLITLSENIGIADRKDLSMDTVRERWPWELLKPRVDSLTAYVKNQGIEKIFLLGFCWGGWLGAHMVASPGFENYTSQAIGHPSCQLEERVFNRPTQSLIDCVQCPIFFLPTRGDPDEYRESGQFYLTLKARFPATETLDFPNQDHGFIPRSDLSIPENKAAVDLALEKILAYFATF